MTFANIEHNSVSFEIGHSFSTRKSVEWIGCRESADKSGNFGGTK